MPIIPIATQTREDLQRLLRELPKARQHKMDALMQEERGLANKLESVRQKQRDIVEGHQTDMAAVTQVLELTGVKQSEVTVHDVSANDAQPPPGYPSNGNHFELCLWALRTRNVASKPKELDKLVRPYESEMRTYALTELCSRAARGGRLVRADFDGTTLYGLPEWAEPGQRNGEVRFKPQFVPPRYRGAQSLLDSITNHEYAYDAEEAVNAEEAAQPQPDGP